MSGFSFDFGQNGIESSPASSDRQDTNDGEFDNFLDLTIRHKAQREAEYLDQQRVLSDLPQPFAPPESYLSKQHFSEIISRFDLYDALGLFGNDSRKMTQYFSIFHPELNLSQAENLSVAISNLPSSRNDFNQLLPHFKRTLPSPSLEIEKSERFGNCYNLRGSSIGATYIDCICAFPVRIPVAENGQFEGLLPLPYLIIQDSTANHIQSATYSLLIQALSIGTRERSELALHDVAEPIVIHEASKGTFQLLAEIAPAKIARLDASALSRFKLILEQEQLGRK